VRALLVVAHGSRRSASNDEVEALTKLLRARVMSQTSSAADTEAMDVKSTGLEFDYVGCAFLELAEPSIPEGLRQCASAGADKVVVLPYFLSAGRHVSQDIPDIIALARSNLPSLNIEIAPYLGTATDLPDLMLELAGI